MFPTQQLADNEVENEVKENEEEKEKVTEIDGLVKKICVLFSLYLIAEVI